MVAGAVGEAAACTGFYVGKKVSADGTTLIGRTVDTTPWTACFRTVVTPRVENKPGRIHHGLRGFSWPLPATTWRYASTPAVSAFQDGAFESGCVNERGLGVSGTVTGYVRAEVRAADPYVEGGAAEESLPGLLAASCATAREAVELIGRVIAEKGNSEPNIYLVADTNEAWHIETYSGHQWAAVRLADDRAAVFGNRFMLRGFDPSAPDVRSSPGLVSVPEKAGFLVRDAAGRIDLFRTYGGKTADYSHLRTWYGRHVLAPSAHPSYVPDEPGELLFVPERKVSCADIFRLMRSRYEGLPWCPEETGRRDVRVIGTTKQATSHVISVADGLPQPLAATMWVAHGPAEHSVFLPIAAASKTSADAYARDFAGPRRDYIPDCAAAAFRRLCALAELDRARYGAGVRAFWEKREERLLKSWKTALRRAAGSWAEDSGKAIGDITRFTMRVQRAALDEARFMFDDLMWYVTANNRIPGDVNGAFPPDDPPYAPPPAAAMPVRSWWPSREKAKAEEIAKSKGTFDLVFVGDSITHNWENPHRGKEVCDELAKTYSILNLGYSGNRTENVIWRFAKGGELEGYRAKLFMVMIGVNNVDDTAEEIALGIRRIIDLIRSRQPQAKVLLLAVFPIDRSPSSRNRIRNGKVNDIIRTYADGEHVLWCDFNDRFLEADGTYPKALAPDGWHPHERGYEIWRDSVIGHFRKVCGK